MSTSYGTLDDTTPTTRAEGHTDYPVRPTSGGPSIANMQGRILELVAGRQGMNFEALRRPRSCRSARRRPPTTEAREGPPTAAARWACSFSIPNEEAGRTPSRRRVTAAGPSSAVRRADQLRAGWRRPAFGTGMLRAADGASGRDRYFFLRGGPVSRTGYARQ